jgi:hypothetical protein
VLVVVIVVLVGALAVVMASGGSSDPGDASSANAEPAPEVGEDGSDIASMPDVTTEDSSAAAATPSTTRSSPVELSVAAITARASSVLPPVSSLGLTYGADNLLDGDPTTAWSQAGTDGGQPAVGSWVAFDLPQPTDVTTVGIVNGYIKSDKAYTENARPRSIVISSEDGVQVRATLADIRTQQDISVDLAGASTVTITIESVYPGSKHVDVAMTEVRFTGIVAD